MTVVAQPPVGVQPYVRPSLRYRLFRAAIVLTALAVLGGGIATLIYVNHYQPLEPGNYGMDVNPNLAEITDGVRTTGYIATGPTGSTSLYRATLANRGHFDVRLLGLEPLLDVGTVQWKVPGQNADFDLSTPGWTSRPLTLHPGQQVEFAVAILRPKCPRHSSYSRDSIPIRWSALGVHHVYNLPFGGFDPAPLYTCYPRSALAHVQH